MGDWMKRMAEIWMDLEWSGKAGGEEAEREIYDEQHIDNLPD